VGKKSNQLKLKGFAAPSAEKLKTVTLPIEKRREFTSLFVVSFKDHFLQGSWKK
jgi:hypothetical protein